MIRRHLRLGVSRVEVLGSIACLVVLGVVISVGLGQGNASKDDASAAAPALHPKSKADAAQLQQTYAAFVKFAEGSKGRFPVPGLINRSAFDFGDGHPTQQPNIGPEDVAQNTTANLYSAMIAQQYFPPALVISPVERNPRVKVAAEYNYDAYNPAADMYWDPNFKADLAAESNTSYAHLPLIGARKKDRWRDTGNPNDAVISNRGPKDGRLDPGSFTCGPHGHWAGRVVYNDGHIQMHTSMTVDGDNLFRFDEGRNQADIFLTFTKEITQSGPVFQHD